MRLLHQSGSYNIFPASLNSEGPLKKELEDIGFTSIPEFRLSSFYDANFIRQIRNCARFIKENKIDVIHTHDFYTNIFGMFSARYAGVKARIASKRETGSMRSNLQKRIEKQAFRFSHGIVVNAWAVKDYLISEGISEDKINVIYNGLDLERLSPKISDRAKICEGFGLPEDKSLRFITLVANLRHEVKNQPMFLRAAKEVLAAFPDAGFILAGEGELRGGLEAMAREMGIADKVYFIGSCDKVAELLSISYACVLSSFNEGFSNSILEYMAAGRPVVATRVGGAAEAIIENETGFLVESDNHEMMAGRLLELLNDEGKAEAFGLKAKSIVAEKFSLEAQLQNTIALYEKILNGK